VAEQGCERVPSGLFSPEFEASIGGDGAPEVDGERGGRRRCFSRRLNEMPGCGATGDWPGRMSAQESGGYTLDIDATRIVADKREAPITGKGEKGY